MNIKLKDFFNNVFLKSQKDFEKNIAFKMAGASSFLASVRNHVAKRSFYKKREKEISKSLNGKILGMTEASIQTRLTLALRDANISLRETSEKMKCGDLNLSWSDDQLKDWAQSKADKCSRMLKNGKSVEEFKNLVESYGFVWALDEHDLPPMQSDLFAESAQIMRCCDIKFWIRRARVKKIRVMDQIARDLRMVHAMAQPYASNEAVKLRRSQSIRNRSILQGMEAVNNEGQSYTLEELSDLSVSNPVNRKHELMVRARGFETLANTFGHVGLFTTMSLPSKYHPTRQIKNRKTNRIVKVVQNDKYEGFSPRDGQEWLAKTWSLIRAQMAREGIECYGFRVVEPHADGCPHWHQLLFFDHESIEPVKKIFKKYCFRENGDEPGAKNHRLKIVQIDEKFGSATGYIAKYISKNIDGTNIDFDLLGNNAQDAAFRIRAWAGAWGIRQFQQIGGGSVTVWRELRRMDFADGIVEEAREAADAADWAAYCLIQGNNSPFVHRKFAPISAAYWLEFDAETGEVIGEEFNRYGEISPGKIFGVKNNFTGKCFLSRFFNWTIKRIVSKVKEAAKSVPFTNMTPEDLLDLLRGDGSGVAA